MSRNHPVLLACISSLVLCAVTNAGAQTIGRLPAFVVNDNNGNPIGPVVSLDAGVGRPIVRIEDTNVNVPVFLEVLSTTQLDSIMSTTYFDATGCAGAAYHNAGFGLNEDGVQALYGYAYSVAFSDSAQRLFRSDVTITPTAGNTMQSRFTSNQGCLDETLDIDSRAAVEVLNLDAAFPPPYSGG